MKGLPLLPWFCVVLGAVLAHWRVLPPLGGFLLVLVSVPVGLAVAVIITWFWFRGHPVPHGAILCATALAPGALIILAGRDVFRFPRINDVSTDLEWPPAFTAVAALPENGGRDMSYPQSFTPIVRNAYPHLSPAVWPSGHADANSVFETAKTVAERSPGWTVIRVDLDAMEIEAVVESELFRFRDYVAIRISIAGDSTRLDVRSKSRDGKSDLGINARRINTYLAKVSAEHTP